jgi:hypothetical protein
MNMGFVKSNTLSASIHREVTLPSKEAMFLEAEGV